MAALATHGACDGHVLELLFVLLVHNLQIIAHHIVRLKHMASEDVYLGLFISIWIC
jgi:hypothetical protein